MALRRGVFGGDGERFAETGKGEWLAVEFNGK